MIKYVIIAAALLVVAVVTALVVYVTVFKTEPVTQPIQFNHKKHMDDDEDFSCESCHKNAYTGTYATIPSITYCITCHKEPDEDNPSAEQDKVREYYKQKKEIPWVRVNRLPGHVYFSHVAHVKYGEMKCEECHGDVREMTEPVTVSQIDHLDMDRCMECHEEKNVSNDCLTCHK